MITITSSSGSTLGYIENEVIMKSNRSTIERIDKISITKSNGSTVYRISTSYEKVITTSSGNSLIRLKVEKISHIEIVAALHFFIENNKITS